MSKLDLLRLRFGDQTLVENGIAVSLMLITVLFIYGTMRKEEETKTPELDSRDTTPFPPPLKNEDV